MNGVSDYEAAACNLLLLAVRVTELVDSVFISCTWNHCVGDGTSFWHLFNVWSELSRGSFGGSREKVLLSQPRPIIGRNYFQAVINLSIRTPFSPTERVLPQKCQRRMVNFSKEKIAELKARANAEAAAGTTGDHHDLVPSSADGSSLGIRDSNLGSCLLHGSNGTEAQILAAIASGIPQKCDLKGDSKVDCGGAAEARLGWAARLINMAITSWGASAETRKFFEDWMKSPQIARVRKPQPNQLFTGSSPWFDAATNSVREGRLRCEAALRICSTASRQFFLGPRKEASISTFGFCLSHLRL